MTPVARLAEIRQNLEVHRGHIMWPDEDIQFLLAQLDARTTEAMARVKALEDEIQDLRYELVEEYPE